MTGQGDVQTANGAVLPQLQSVTRLSKLPIVESALGVASGIYGKVKDSSRVVNWTLSRAEGVGAAALGPVASRFEWPIHAVDHFLGRGMDIVEEKVPAIKMTPQQMMDNTLHLVAAGLGLNASGPEASVTTRVVGASVGVAATGLRSAVSVVEWYMDKNFPASPEEQQVEQREEKGEAPSETQQVLIRWQKVSRRMHRMLTNSVKRQREDIAGFLGRVAEYIKDASHPKILDKVASRYAEISKILQEKGVSTRDMTAKVAHQMTALAVDILGDVSSSIASVPGGIVSRLGDARRYGMDVVKSVLPAEG